MRALLTEAVGSVGVWVVAAPARRGDEIVHSTETDHANGPLLVGAVPFHEPDVLDANGLAEMLNRYE